jgi:hypothetical protein
MATPESILFTSAAMIVLDQMPLDAGARASFEYLSGGVMWPDEFPLIGSPERREISPPSAIGSVLAYRGCDLSGALEQARFIGGADDHGPFASVI